MLMDELNNLHRAALIVNIKCKLWWLLVMKLLTLYSPDSFDLETQ